MTFNRARRKTRQSGAVRDLFEVQLDSGLALVLEVAFVFGVQLLEDGLKTERINAVWEDIVK